MRSHVHTCHGEGVQWRGVRDGRDVRGERCAMGGRGEGGVRWGRCAVGETCKGRGDLDLFRVGKK